MSLSVEYSVMLVLGCVIASGFLAGGVAAFLFVWKIVSPLAPDRRSSALTKLTAATALLVIVWVVLGFVVTPLLVSGRYQEKALEIADGGLVAFVVLFLILFALLTASWSKK